MRRIVGRRSSELRANITSAGAFPCGVLKAFPGPPPRLLNGPRLRRSPGDPELIRASTSSPSMTGLSVPNDPVGPPPSIPPGAGRALRRDVQQASFATARVYRFQGIPGKSCDDSGPTRSTRPRDTGGGVLCAHAPADPATCPSTSAGP